MIHNEYPSDDDNPCLDPKYSIPEVKDKILIRGHYARFRPGGNLSFVINVDWPKSEIPTPVNIKYVKTSAELMMRYLINENFIEKGAPIKAEVYTSHPDSNA